MPGPGTFFGIEIARRGISSHQKSLEVTGHNIANANNPAYSRQEAVHTASSPWPYPSASSGVTPGQLGSGVEIDMIRRIRNEYLDTQFRTTNASQSYWESRMEILEQVESIFPEPDGRGIQEVLVTFFSDWHALNNAPQDDGIKSAVVESGKELARMFRDTYTSLENVKTSIIENNTTGKIPDQVDRINELAGRIAELTRSIIRVRREGREPNDLLDKRDALLDELSHYAPVQVEKVLDSGKDLGGIKVTLFPSSISEPLIKTDSSDMNVTTKEVKVKYSTGTDIKLDYIENGSTSEVASLTTLAANQSAGGSLVGLVSAWQDNNDFIDRLNQLARSIGDAVNTLYDPEDSSLPQDFWVFKDSNGNLVTTNRTAGQIYVKEDLINAPEKLDGEEALRVARLRNQTQVYVGRKENINDKNWNLNIVADNEAPILDGFIFKFNSDTENEVTCTISDSIMNISADWDNSASKAPTLADIEAKINQAFSDNGFSATVSLGVDSGTYSASDIGNVTSFDIKLNDVLNLNGSTIEGYYRGYIADLASKTESAQNMYENQQAILEQVTGLRQSTSGVSIDEELSNMIQFQYGYQASARMLTTLDSILDTLINRMAV